MTKHSGASWLIFALGALCAGAIIIAVLVVGPASGSQTSVTRTATAATGVVQATVSGSGNLQAASQVDLGFKTSGVVSDIYVHQGEHVAEGQLLAELNPKSAEVTLEQSRATLQAARASLAQLEEDEGETSSGSGSGSGSSATGKAATASKTATEPKKEPEPKEPEPKETEPKETEPSKSTESEATRAANIASAHAAVRSDELGVENDEQALTDTKLYAPKTGTIVSLNGEVGESVSAQGTTKASSGSAEASGSGSSGTGTGAATGSGRSGTGSSTGSSGAGSSSSSSASSGSSFAVLSDLSAMELVAPLSESEIGEVRRGQIATVTVEALEGRKLAAHVNEVATLSTSNSGVVSYDVTFTLDQMDAGLKPGMSASAEVVVKQAAGVNVPTSAISAGSVTVLHGSTRERRRVVAGLAGDSTTIVLSGLHAGETVLLPTATSTGTGTGGLSSRLGGRGGGALGGPAGGGFPGGGGGPVLFRGGG